MLQVLIDVLLPILTVVVVGYTLRRRMALDLTTINRITFYGLSPALIFVSLTRAQVSGATAAQMVLFSVGLVACMGLITLACALPLRVRGAELSALLLTSMFMNSGNYGLPLARFALGEAGFERAVLFFIPQSILAQTLGVGVAASAGMEASGLGARLGLVLRRVLRMPQIYAASAALLVRGLGITIEELPGVAGALFRGLALLSEAALPLLLMVLGMQLAQSQAAEGRRLVALAVGLRLLVSPMVGLGLALALGMGGLDLKVGLLQAAMPTAVNMTLVALEFKARPSFVVSAVVASSVGSLLTLSVMLALLR